MSQLSKISRPHMLDIARKIHALLVARQASGPAEPALDVYIPALEDMIGRLETHVGGRDLANAARATRLARAESADVLVDTWLRHTEGFLYVEANRREGANVTACKALYQAACPRGLAHVDDRIAEENAHCRAMLEVLRAPEHADLLAAIELPPTWLDKFETALAESEEAIAAVVAARDETTTHVDLGRDAEDDWVDLMIRLRHYIASRAGADEAEKRAEGRALLQPLSAVLQKLRTDAAARATRRAAAPPAQSPQQDETPA